LAGRFRCPVPVARPVHRHGDHPDRLRCGRRGTARRTARPDTAPRRAVLLRRGRRAPAPGTGRPQGRPVPPRLPATDIEHPAATHLTAVGNSTSDGGDSPEAPAL
jgi:hypothetical protein